MSLVRIVRQIESFHFSSIKRDERCHYCRNNEDNVAGVNLADESSDDFLLVSRSDSSELRSEWILDSRCSFHIFPNKE
ncbi:hypothetical protein Gotri_007286, partial [Gossypium trilobum]|nr:hypothetical protein [Gossypium trilobum]